MGKLLKIEQLDEALDHHRQQGHCIVSINGCFDLLHSGHIYILREARMQGEVLVVGLNSDSSIQALKGIQRPILPQQDRAELLCALEMVDYVVLFDEPDCRAFVAAVQPNVHVNDASYGEHCIEAEIVRNAGGRLHLIKKRPGLSTTEIIQKIKGLNHD